MLIVCPHISHSRKLPNPLAHLPIPRFYTPLSQVLIQSQDLNYTRLHPSRQQGLASTQPCLCLLSLCFLIPNPPSARAGSHGCARCSAGWQQRNTPDAFPQSLGLLSLLLLSCQSSLKVTPTENFCLCLAFTHVVLRHSVQSSAPIAGTARSTYGAEEAGGVRHLLSEALAFIWKLQRAVYHVRSLSQSPISLTSNRL